MVNLLLGINGDNVQTEGIDKRNLDADAVKGTFSGFGQSLKNGLQINPQKTYSKMGSVFESTKDAKSDHMFICVFNFDFGVFAVDDEFSGKGNKKGGFFASFRIIANKLDASGSVLDTVIFGETQRDFSSDLVAAAVTYDVTFGGNAVRSTSVGSQGLPHKMHVPLQNTATLFIGGKFGDLMPQFFPFGSETVTVEFLVQGKCHRTKDDSKSVTGRIFNYNTFLRVIKK